MSKIEKEYINDWVSLHFYYYDQYKYDQLILKLLEFLKSEKNNLKITQYFFIRYWEGGPHIRLRYKTVNSNEYREEVFRKLKEIADDFWKNHPTTVILNESDYQKVIKEVPDSNTESLEYLIPSETIKPIKYDPEFERYGNNRLMIKNESFFEISSDISVLLLKFLLNKDSSYFHKLIVTTATLKLLIEITLARYTSETKDILNHMIDYWQNNNIFLDKTIVSHLMQHQNQIDKFCKFLKKYAKEEMIKIQKINEEIYSLSSEDDFYYGVISSQFHMLANRLGIFPKYEIVCLEVLKTFI
ncbi:thiopeptide-type bacteriocin biosynthesis protein [Dolosigranulum pigrum]|jgi:thiopeptide-type bacteriocin biosynthesis domain|uniref:thiopeptide-type bacteriocin biosynthesis protein n=1 Tax=Dolosigranulum pigrum TaxID=29394 RepID=UPI001AD882EB|nr:thiopeptide-type bacteriocin biosynthesis protein [Dolosigranulum pigrum]QTJ37717.1 hypothetical protein FE324_02600 [Dolosigranulum pigrum]QTJ45607.1 hypothetical protein FE328_08725 [Dolosigranulum pigrum]